MNKANRPPGLGFLKSGIAAALLATTLAAGANGNIIGTWVSEPTLGQLGYIQQTYIFRKNGKFSLKMDFQSFCGMGAVTPDCEYFWMVGEGRYAVSGDKLTLHMTRRQRIQQRKGAPHPLVQDDAAPASMAYTYTLQGNSLTLQNKGQSLILRRQP